MGSTSSFMRLNVRGAGGPRAHEATIVDGSIWGRGTLDDKGELVAICEAAESLLEAGLHPRPGRVAELRLRRGGLRPARPSAPSPSSAAAAYVPGS